MVLDKNDTNGNGCLFQRWVLLDRKRKKASRKRVLWGEDIIISFIQDRVFIDKSGGCSSSLGALGRSH